jgi:hypothetical protein
MGRDRLVTASGDPVNDDAGVEDYAPVFSAAGVTGFPEGT